MRKILVTTYTNPDLDGCACMTAYAELLRRQGKDAVAGYFGEPQQDAKFGFEKAGQKLPDKVSGQDYDEVVLVDVSNVQRLDESIDPKKVVEIIDHHEPDLDDFPSAKAQIEHLGAVATLVAERVKQANQLPSKEVAKTLQLAILHGTINFQAKLSTQKDKEMFEWLSSVSLVSQEDIDKFFRMITTFSGTLLDFLRDDFKDFDVEGVKFGIAAMLIFGLDDFLKKNKQEVLEALEILKQEKSLEYVWFGCTDLKNASSYFLVPDDKTEKSVAEGLGLSFSNHESRVSEIVLRKENLKQMTEYLKGK